MHEKCDFTAIIFCLSNLFTFHKDMNDFLKNKTDDFGSHMRPQRGNSGQKIRQNFTRQERLGALRDFYNGSGAKYSDAAKDFFKQHPDL